MTEPKWCSIDGSEWSIVIGDITATVWLLDDEETYCANIRLSNKDSIYADEFDCIKKAKAACIEVIEDHLDIKDAEAVMDEPSEELEIEVQCPRCRQILVIGDIK